MPTLTDKQLTELGFKLLPKVTDECDDGFAYRVAEIKTSTSLIEIINEYRDDKLTKQLCNYEIIEDGSTVIDVELIKKLKTIIQCQKS